MKMKKVFKKQKQIEEGENNNRDQEESPIQCWVCTKTFENYLDLNSHIDQHHDTTFSALIEGEDSDNQNLQPQHVPTSQKKKTHFTSKSNAKHGAHSMKTKKLLKKQNQKEDGKNINRNQEETPIQCWVCYKTFENYLELNSHIAQNHDTAFSALIEGEDVDNQNSQLSNILTYAEKKIHYTSESNPKCRTHSVKTKAVIKKQSHNEDNENNIRDQKEPPIQCWVCYKTFENYLDLNSHVAQNHDSTFSALIEGENADNHNSQRHHHVPTYPGRNTRSISESNTKHRTHSGKTKVFRKQKQNEFSENNNRAQEEPSVQCWMCYKKFENYLDLNSHIAQHHDTAFSALIEGKDVDNQNSQPPKVLNCPGKNTHLSSKLNAKQRTHFVKTKKVLNKRNQNEDGENNSRNQEEPPIQCWVCYKSFKNYLDLNSHVAQNHDTTFSALIEGEDVDKQNSQQQHHHVPTIPEKSTHFTSESSLCNASQGPILSIKGLDSVKAQENFKEQGCTSSKSVTETMKSKEMPLILIYLKVLSPRHDDTNSCNELNHVDNNAGGQGFPMEDLTDHLARVNIQSEGQDANKKRHSSKGVQSHCMMSQLQRCNRKINKTLQDDKSSLNQKQSFSGMQKARGEIQRKQRPKEKQSFEVIKYYENQYFERKLEKIQFSIKNLKINSDQYKEKQYFERKLKRLQSTLENLKISSAQYKEKQYFERDLKRIQSSIENLKINSGQYKEKQYFERKFKRIQSSTENLKIKSDQHKRLRMHKKSFKCDECSKNYKSWIDLRRHLRTHTRERSHQCDRCSKRFFGKDQLRAHTRTHTGEKPYQCEICSKKFRTATALKEHTIHTLERPYKCNECDKSFKSSIILKKHAKMHTGEKPHQCERCRKRFFSKGELKSHLKTHTGEKPFQCDICSKSFLSTSALKIHRRTHTGEKPFKCDECDKSFTKNNHLKVHKRTHTGEKPIQCDKCSKRFFSSSGLKKHATKHTDVEAHKCNECGKSFKNSAYLKEHSRKHTEEKPFQCYGCSERFLTKSALKIHAIKHTDERPFKCNECDKSFKRSAHLREHTRKHTGERSFKCNDCDQSFYQISNLKRHALSLHSGETTYLCDACGKKFSNKKDLKAHTKTHKGE